MNVIASYQRELWKRVFKTCNLYSKRSQTTSTASHDILPEPILTTTVKERILELYKSDPEKWSKQILATRFKVSERTIKFLVEIDRLALSVVSRLDQEALQHFQKMYEKRKSVESSSLLSNQRAAFSEPQPKPVSSIRSWPKLERKDDLAGETTDDVLQQLGFRTMGTTTTEDKQSVEREVELVKKYLEPSSEASYKSLGLLEDAVSPRRTKYLFVDISRKIRNDCRPIYVRDFDGNLRDANREERLKVLVALGGPYDILKPYLKEYYLEKPLSEQVEEKVALQTKVALWRKLKKAKKKARRKGQFVETPKE
ncbi:hypothetical protein GpartN1_g4118.t1 [Galdieria partita]|uniref:Uncharacterized protein n=1 Tax=Galdieria partita TaxID=83374 RepID=A0A9C7PZE9_9RHOD|nr:hypothetical protein GpartN1_g4118.t1 [Galdieria partita]